MFLKSKLIFKIIKKIVLAAIAVMGFSFANAQDVKFGVKGGLNVANLTGDLHGSSVKSNIGFNVGGFAEIKLSEKFSIQPELLCSTQGAKIKRVEDNYSYEGKLNLAYINLPVMARFYVVPKFSVEAGPQIGMLVGAKEKSEEIYNGLKNSYDENVRDYYKKMDFGLNVGAGYDITENLSIGARYNFGLSNIAKTEDGEDFKLHNEVFSFLVAYKF